MYKLQLKAIQDCDNEEKVHVVNHVVGSLKYQAYQKSLER